MLHLLDPLDECRKDRAGIYGGKQGLGLEHPDTLTSMFNLASTYRNQGRWNGGGKAECACDGDIQDYLSIQTP
jgi:hypothetical protein